MPAFYFDAHCDTLSRIAYTCAKLSDNDFHISLKKAKCSILYIAT